MLHNEPLQYSPVLFTGIGLNGTESVVELKCCHTAEYHSEFKYNIIILITGSCEIYSNKNSALSLETSFEKQ